MLAKRATFGSEVGTICVDGHIRDASFQRKIGYVQQEDIHTPTGTVREALEFSALMRQAGDCSKTKLKYVDSVIQLLEMQAYADAVVGVPGNGELRPLESIVTGCLQGLLTVSAQGLTLSSASD